MLSANTIRWIDQNAVIMKPEIRNGNQILIKHPEYTYPVCHDIGLIRISRPIEFTVRNNRFIVNSICLPPPNFQPISVVVYAIGWGFDEKLITPFNLQKIKLHLINVTVCGRIWRLENIDYPDQRYPEYVLCAGNKFKGAYSVIISVYNKYKRHYTVCKRISRP